MLDQALEDRTDTVPGSLIGIQVKGANLWFQLR